MTRVLSQPHTREALKAGIDTLAAAVVPTLGPLAGPVALDDATRKGSPELLDDGGVIARRILQLDDRHADVGAMLLREVLWRQKEQFGDGAATAAVLFQTVFDEGHRFISAGGNAMLLRVHLEQGANELLTALQAGVRALSGAEEIKGLAYSICGDEEIAATLADIFEVLGPHHPVEVREGGRDLGHEFFLGSYWESKVPSEIVFEGQMGQRLNLRNTAWLISDFELDDMSALVNLVTSVYEFGHKSLVVVAKSFSGQIMAAQGANSRMQDFKLVYLELTGLVDEQDAALEDLALITGGQSLRQMAGHTLEKVTPAALGVSELAWIDRNRCGIIAGEGDPKVIKNEVDILERYYRSTEDERRAEVLRLRIGRLRGGSAVIYCGGSSASEMRYQQARIERAIAAVRSAMLGGTVAGGGTALLRCLTGLRARFEASDDLHERAAFKILMKAAAAPCQALLVNAGHEAPGVVLDEISRSNNGSGFDLRAGELTDMRESGVVDSAEALMAVVRGGIGGAALALTVDTIVHRVNPPLAIEPGGLPASTNMGSFELK